MAGDAPRRSAAVHVRGGVAAIIAAAALVVAVGPAGASGSVAAEAADRVLVVSLPHVSWSDLDGLALPNLRRILRGAALANMTTRTISAANIASGYLTLGAGTRAAAPNKLTDGAGLEVDERFSGELASDVFGQRTGSTPARGIVHLGLAPILDVNDDEEVDVHVGALGDALARAGYSRAVIGNADGYVLGTDIETFGRSLVAALMDAEGRVRDGQVSQDLLRDDPKAPFGARLDPDSVEEAFAEVWRPRSVVVVEASDLVRVKDAGALTDPAIRLQQQRAALERADALIGRLLERVDFAHDAVFVVSPAPNLEGNRLAVAAVRTPGGEPGLMRSASTRRDGYVLLADVAPTILDVLGLDRARDMQGRRFQTVADRQTFQARIDGLVEASDVADFRERTRTAVIIAFVAMQAALAAAVLWLLRRGTRPWLRVLLDLAPLAVLAFVPVLYLVRLLPAHDWGFAGYAAMLAVATLGLAAVYQRLAPRRRVDQLLLGLGVLVAVLVVDVVTGARLQLNSAFGYGPTVGVRLAGFGNISFAALAAASLLFAGLLAFRVGGRLGAIAASAVVGVAVVVDANPLWGSDVGGVIALSIAGLATVLLLIGREVRLRARTIAIGLAVPAAALAAAIAIDYARPPDQRTHLGRLVGQITDEGPGVLLNVLIRKLGRNLATAAGSPEWLVMALLVLPFLWYLTFKAPVRLHAVIERIPALRAALVGFAIAATLGYALNDTGIAVPGVMLGILTPTLVLLLLEPFVDGSSAHAWRRRERTR